MNLRNKGPEWLRDDYKEARPVTVDLFIRRSILFEFFPQTLSFDFSSFFPPYQSVNETESNLVPPHCSADMAYYDPKIPHTALIDFILWKHAVADGTCASIYKTNLPTMTPTTKKSTIRATARVLSPSSFLIPTEGCWDDIMLLFLIRSPSSSYSGMKIILELVTKTMFRKMWVVAGDGDQIFNQITFRVRSASIFIWPKTYWMAESSRP